MTERHPLTLSTDDRLGALAIIRAWAHHDPDALGVLNRNAGPNMHLALIDTAAEFAKALATVNGTTLDDFLDRGVSAFATTEQEN